MDKTNKPSVSVVTNHILKRTEAVLGTSGGKALLANLRNSIGKPLSETVTVWPLMYEYLPEAFLSKSAKTTAEERAILTSLQLYALHQQGKSESILANTEKSAWNNIGASLKALRKGDDSVAMDRRFNALITSSSEEELIYHLRQMIKLLKSKGTDVKVDYGRLAQDLYWFMRGYEENLRLSWARAYYSWQGKEETKEDE